MLVNRTCEKFVLSRLMAATLQSALFPAPKGCVTSSKSQWVRFVFLPPSICRLFRCIDFRGWCWLKGHVEMTETMRQCLELLLAPPTRFTSVLVIVQLVTTHISCRRYITAVRRPLPRSQSHFRFDNLFSWQFRKLPPPRGFEQSTGNLTYSEWYLKFGRDVLLPNSGCD